MADLGGSTGPEAWQSPSTLAVAAAAVAAAVAAAAAAVASVSHQWSGWEVSLEEAGPCSLQKESLLALRAEDNCTGRASGARGKRNTDFGTATAQCHSVGT